MIMKTAEEVYNEIMKRDQETDELECPICKGRMTYWHPGSKGYGNNARPLNDGRCCDWCNEYLVIPARLMRHANSRSKGS